MAAACHDVAVANETLAYTIEIVDFLRRQADNIPRSWQNWARIVRKQLKVSPKTRRGGMKEDHPSSRAWKKWGRMAAQVILKASIADAIDAQ